MKYHPDKNNNSEESCEKFKEVNSAYLCLYNLSVSLGSRDSHMDLGDEDSTSTESYMSIFKIFMQSLMQKCIPIFRKRMQK